MMARAKPRISFGIVAEKSSVWRLAGSASTMRRTSGQKPMSSIRSASSSTSVSRPSNLVPERMWSISRPGVATTNGMPAARARDCGSIGAPP
jgi:hypothetical protein